jgi:hypothetical protein
MQHLAASTQHPNEAILTLMIDLKKLISFLLLSGWEPGVLYKYISDPLTVPDK